MTNGPEHGRRRTGSARRQRRLRWWIVAVVAVLGAAAVGSEIVVRHVATARVTAAVADRLHAAPTVDIGLAQAGGSLPFGLTVTGVNPTSGGFEITFEASNTPLG
jgi:hypothetical protein